MLTDTNAWLADLKAAYDGDVLAYARLTGLIASHVIVLRPRLTVTEAKLTCPACPTQVEGTLEDGRAFYFRMRWGSWSISLDDEVVAIGDEPDDFTCERLFSEQGFTVAHWL